MTDRKLLILGTRGIPACHGGFETFAEKYSVFMHENGWDVSVYCQEFGDGPVRSDVWHGVRRILIPTKHDSSLGSIFFDFKAMIHASRQDGIILTLGYNTAIFTIIPWLKRRKTVMNMDGIEWARKKWSFPVRVWLYINEWIGAKLNQVLIADHPEISKHLQRHTGASKIRVIPYGASAIDETDSTDALDRLGIKSQEYGIVIARTEPENSILEIVTAWSRAPRGVKLVVLGNYQEELSYHRDVKRAASDEVVFPGAIYDKKILDAIRCNARVYLHGHQVGGTNPSLVESMGAGNAIIAHGNRFNRWVAGDGALYFANIDECERRIEQVLSDDNLHRKLVAASSQRHREYFTLEMIHGDYMNLVDELRRSGQSVSQ